MGRNFSDKSGIDTVLLRFNVYIACKSNGCFGTPFLPVLSVTIFDYFLYDTPLFSSFFPSHCYYSRNYQPPYSSKPAILDHLPPCFLFLNSHSSYFFPTPFPYQDSSVLWTVCCIFSKCEGSKFPQANERGYLSLFSLSFSHSMLNVDDRCVVATRLRSQLLDDWEKKKRFKYYFDYVLLALVHFSSYIFYFVHFSAFGRCIF